MKVSHIRYLGILAVFCIQGYFVACTSDDVAVDAGMDEDEASEPDNVLDENEEIDRPGDEPDTTVITTPAPEETEVPEPEPVEVPEDVPVEDPEEPVVNDPVFDREVGEACDLDNRCQGGTNVCAVVSDAYDPNAELFEQTTCMQSCTGSEDCGLGQNCEVMYGLADPIEGMQYLASNGRLLDEQEYTNNDFVPTASYCVDGPDSESRWAISTLYKIAATPDAEGEDLWDGFNNTVDSTDDYPDPIFCVRNQRNTIPLWICSYGFGGGEYVWDDEEYNAPAETILYSSLNPTEEELTETSTQNRSGFTIDELESFEFGYWDIDSSPNPDDRIFQGTFDMRPALNLPIGSTYHFRATDWGVDTGRLSYLLVSLTRVE